MSEVRLPRLLLVLVSVLVIAGCAGRPDNPSINAGVCSSGVASINRQAPIVCVDDTGATLTVSPDPAEANDVLEGPRTNPVIVHWWTKSGGGNLGIEMKGSECVGRVECSGGHCWAKTKPGAKAKVTCKYDVWTNATNRLDPTIVINPCCP